MIARLAGALVEKQPGRAVIDVGGVGYEVAIPLSTYYRLGDPGSRVELHVHTHVRAEALALFGFCTRKEKALFALLIGVSGVGPKTAIALLSGLEIDDLIDAVRQKDGGRLAAIPGIGRKTSERILIELADKVDSAEVEPAPSPGGPADGASLRRDLVSALVNLGYNARVAGDATGRVLKGKGTEGFQGSFQGLLRETLRVLSR